MPTIHEFAVPASEFDAAGKSFSFPLRAAWLRGALEGCEVNPTEKDGSLDVRLSASGRDVVALGKLRAELVVPCARCLGPARIPIDHDFSVMFVPSPTRSETEEYDFTAEEADTLPFDGETVIMDELVRDELLLEIPMIPLCSEACPGMSPGPATDEAGSEEPSPEEAIDPRLLPLMRWKAPQKS